MLLVGTFQNQSWGNLPTLWLSDSCSNSFTLSPRSRLTHFRGFSLSNWTSEFPGRHLELRKEIPAESARAGAQQTGWRLRGASRKCLSLRLPPKPVLLWLWRAEVSLFRFCLFGAGGLVWGCFLFFGFVSLAGRKRDELLLTKKVSHGGWLAPAQAAIMGNTPF